MADPITQSQLNALERAIDSVFGKLGIDVDFTRHFLDRVNDERNVRQITIRELGELFAKEYKRWGNTIKHMPIDAQAVMKDLSSAINVPFVLNKDEQGKELVAKTVMRKKDFKSPDKTLPVESVETGRQVRGSEPTPKKRRPTSGSETPHPMRGRLVGESAKTTNLKFIKQQRLNGWEVYGNYPYDDNIVKINFLKGTQTFTIMGENDYWELVNNGNKSIFDSLESAFLAATTQTEDFDQPPLDVVTPSIAQVAQRHGISEQELFDQLEMGIQVEMEHTSDMQAAMEIALDHLNERPDYYTQLASVENSAYTPEAVGASWEAFRDLDERLMDPREAILRKALEFMDQRVKARQSGRGEAAKIPLGNIAFDVYREINLGSVASARELAQLYREWRGDTVVREGWMESNLYYLDEVVEAIGHVGTDKKEKFGINLDRYEFKKLPEGEVLASYRNFTVVRSKSKAYWNGDSLLILDDQFKLAGFVGLKSGQGIAGLTPNTIQISTSVVSDKFQGQSVILGAYAALVKAGYSLISDYQQTAGGTKIWSRLAKTPGVYVYAVDFGEVYSREIDSHRVDRKGKKIKFYDVDPEDITDGGIKVFKKDSAKVETVDLENYAWELDDKVKTLRNRLAKMKTDDPQYAELADLYKTYGTEAARAHQDLERLYKAQENTSDGVRLMATAERKQTANPAGGAA
jgi:hypothetical protein